MTTRTKRLAVMLGITVPASLVISFAVPLNTFPLALAFCMISSLVGSEVALYLYPFEAP